MGLTRFKRHSAPVIRSRRWQVLRMQVIERDGGACVACGSRRRLEVDHVRPVRDAPERAFDPGNLQVLCARCHAQKTRVEVGFPPPDPKRAAWREAVRAMENAGA